MENNYQNSTGEETRPPPSYSSHNFQSLLVDCEAAPSRESKLPPPASSGNPRGLSLRERLSSSLATAYEHVALGYTRNEHW